MPARPVLRDRLRAGHETFRLPGSWQLDVPELSAQETAGRIAMGIVQDD